MVDVEEGVGLPTGAGDGVVNATTTALAAAATAAAAAAAAADAIKCDACDKITPQVSVCAWWYCPFRLPLSSWLFA